MYKGLLVAAVLMREAIWHVTRLQACADFEICDNDLSGKRLSRIDVKQFINRFSLATMVDIY